MIREAVFGNIADAQRFVRQLQNFDRRDFSPFPGVPVSSFDSLVGQNHGRLYWSSSRREQLAYHYQGFIYPQDRRYLHERDPTAHAVNTRPAVDTWFKLPRTYVRGIDDFFDYITSLGFTRAAIPTDITQRWAGGAFLYINASGDVSQPLRAASRWFGFDFLRPEDIVEESIVPDESGDPLLTQHGIQSLVWARNDKEKADRQGVEIHGSRLVSFVEDHESRSWVGRAKLDPCFDALWNLRDIEHAQKESQFQGNPVVVEVDTEAGYNSTPEADSAIEAELKELRSGARDSISPVEGLKIRRLGEPKMDDPAPVIRLLASRIATCTELPVNMILASSRGSEQVTDQDRMDYASNIDVRRQTLALPILGHLVRLGQACDLVPRRAVLPSDVEWPIIRTLNPRELAYVDKSDATTLNMALASGRRPPPRIERKFPQNTEPFDPDLILPAQPFVNPSTADPRAENSALVETVRRVVEEMNEEEAA